jgi:hypothetical protein
MRKLTDSQTELLYRLYLDGRLTFDQMNYEDRRRAGTLVDRGLVRTKKEEVEHLGKKWEAVFYFVSFDGVEFIKDNPPDGWTWGRRGLRQLGVYDG